MQVYKFGGTSLGSPQRMYQVLDILAGEASRKCVVLSAMAGTTNQLKLVAELLGMRKSEEAKEELGSMKRQYLKTVKKL